MSSRRVSAGTLKWKMSLSATSQGDLSIFSKQTTGQVQRFLFIVPRSPCLLILLPGHWLLILLASLPQDELSLDDWKLVAKLKKILNIP
jgi:hypothetical protein